MVLRKRTRNIFMPKAQCGFVKDFFYPQGFDREEGCRRKKRWRGAEEKAGFSVGGGVSIDWLWRGWVLIYKKIKNKNRMEKWNTKVYIYKLWKVFPKPSITGSRRFGPNCL
jgi:hypothetical protein